VRLKRFVPAFLVLSAFLASGVEFVEALTIVLAAGLARGWRSSLTGLGVATLVLAVVVVALGPALTVIPLQGLRLVVGALLLVFGLQWLRKAILRASGYKELHDEDAIFARELAEAQGAAHRERAGVDWYGFTLSFKGVLLEGLEVVFIVLTFGSAQGSIPLAPLQVNLQITVPARQEQSIPGKRQRCVTQGPQVSDEVCALLLVLQTREKHICSGQSECGI